MSKPGHYWDHLECQWVRYVAAEVPAQPTVEQMTEMATSAEGVTP